MHHRDADRVVPDHSFARKVAVAIWILTVICVGGAVGIGLANPASAAPASASTR